MRKIILYIAMSLDGYIARENGELDWLPGASGERDATEEDCGYKQFLNTIDTVLMGNQTYKQILSFGTDYPYKGKDNFVFSRTPQPQDENATFVTETPESFAKKLKTSPGKDIWLNGGAKLFGSFFEENLVDELILFVIPTTIGTGIPLFSKTSFESNLELLTTHYYSKGHADGIVKLHYKVSNH